jgi:hypothetical protein
VVSPKRSVPLTFSELTAALRAAIVIIRWQLRRRALAAARTEVVTMPATRFPADHVSSSAGSRNP